MPCQIGGIDIHGGSQIYDFRSRKKVHVESHVLRYWEEELGLSIGRTEWDIDIIPKMTYSFSAVSKD